MYAVNSTPQIKKFVTLIQKKKKKRKTNLIKIKKIYLFLLYLTFNKYALETKIIKSKLRVCALLNIKFNYDY